MNKFQKIINNKYLYLILVNVFYIVMSIFSVYRFTKDGQLAIKEFVDAPFHLSRVQGLSDIFQGPISFDNFLHYGNPVNIFYPWLTLYPMYLFYQISHSLLGAYYTYFIVLAFITLWICYYVAIKITKSRFSAIIFSLLYVFAFYRQSNLAFRHAVGETIAMSIMPLVLYGLYLLFYQKQSQWKLLCISMALLAYTHILSLLMASFLVGLSFIFALINRMINKDKIINFVKCILMSVLLSVGSLIPMQIFSSYSNIEKPVEQFLEDEALSIFDIMKATINNELGTRQYSVGILIFIFSLLIIFTFKKLDIFNKSLVYLSLVFIILSSRLFPWFYFQNLLSPLQFPWRFMGVATLCLGFVAVVSLNKFITIIKSINHFQTFILVIISIIFVQMSLISNFQMHGKEYAKRLKNDHDISYILKKEYNGKTDYMGEKASRYWKFYRSQKVKTSSKSIHTKAKYDGNQVTYQFKLPMTQKIQLPVLANPGIKVYSNDKLISYNKNSIDGVSVRGKKGLNIIKVKSTYPKSILICYAISMVSLIAMFFFYIFSYKRNL